MVSLVPPSLAARFLTLVAVFTMNAAPARGQAPPAGHLSTKRKPWSVAYRSFKNR